VTTRNIGNLNDLPPAAAASLAHPALLVERNEPAFLGLHRQDGLAIGVVTLQTICRAHRLPPQTQRRQGSTTK
jgi:hypothetical protein